MFNTTLTDEYLRVAGAFGFGQGEIEQLVLNALRATLLPEEARDRMEEEFLGEFAALKSGDQSGNAPIGGPA
jgi:adenosine deaminase